MSARKKTMSKRSILIPLFILFFFIALITVIVLEYIDFKKGKDSFIFEKIIRLTIEDETDRADNSFNRQLIELFDLKRFQFTHFMDKSGLYHFKLDIDAADVKDLVGEIKKISAGLHYKLELSEMRQQPHKAIHLYHVKKNRIISHLILISTQISRDEIQKKKPEDSQPKIAFIIDDIGNQSGMALNLKNLNIPITASILPESTFAYDEARQIFQYGLESMLHIPMQPKNSRSNSYRNMTVIQPHFDIDSMKQVIFKARKIIPHAKGVNNHEGSLITSKKNVITKFLKIIKQEELFFVDSRTTPETVAYDVARELQIKTAFRDIFLDSEQTYSHSMKQIRKLISVSLKKGKAIAIGHPFQTTIQAIKDSLKSIRDHKIRIVFVSQLLE